MDISSEIILVVGVLLLTSILASLLSDRLGAPLLLVFLVLGMLMGGEGPGGIKFHDIRTAHLIGNLALALILFDGGLRTRYESFRVGLRPALTLATLGVFITAGLTGWFFAALYGLPWLSGMLLGAIVGSTDAAAVFSLLHSRGLELKRRVGATLEIESGSNDPMAIFLTIALINALMHGHQSLGMSLLAAFVTQIGIGGVMGYLGGEALGRLVNGVTLTPGLYPILTLAGVLVTFGSSAVLGGSGFLAVYLVGLLLGNRPLQASHNIRRFHDGMAWLSQIAMFLVLGLLVEPSQLIKVAPQALLVAAVLMFVARPLAVVVSLAPFRFPWREQAFIAWVGLRGAVPIILGLFPLLAGLKGATVYFNIAFFVVLVSLVLQGWTTAPAARVFGLEVPPSSGLEQRVELDVPSQREYEFVSYRIADDSPALYKPLGTLSLPENTQPVAAFREGVAVKNSTAHIIGPGDYIYLLAPPADLHAVDRVFVTSHGPARLDEPVFFGDFTLNADARLADLAAAYGFEPPLDLEPETTLAQYLERIFKKRVVVGDRVILGKLQFSVREMDDERITVVGLKVSA